jgi:hypothetical protein
MYRTERVCVQVAFIESSDNGDTWPTSDHRFGRRDVKFRGESEFAPGGPNRRW